MEESILIQRHKNPFGIFLRILIYPLIAYGLWEHAPIIILLGLIAEVLNWTMMPPVEKTLGFIQNVIDIELGWLNAENTVAKKVSIGLFGLFPLLMGIGLWVHSIILIGITFGVLIVFNLLMQKIAKSES